MFTGRVSGSDNHAGNFVGPLCFISSEAPRYKTGFLVTVVTSAIAGGLALVYRWYCSWLNHKRDRTGVMEDFEHAYEDDLTDMKVCKRSRPHFQASLTKTVQNPQFRYIL